MAFSPGFSGRRGYGCALALCAAVSPCPAFAQSAEPPAPVEVTVQGAPPPRSASESVVGERVLRAAPHRDGSELMQTVPGVFVSQHSGEGKAHQIFYRGFDAVHGQDMEVWAAGAPVNEVSNLHGQGYADLHFLIPELVQQIESQPGVYDPRQGDFAVAGSLRLRVGQAEPGVIANFVRPNSPAHAAGLQQGDLIREVDGQAVTSFAQAAGLLRAIAKNPARTEFVMLISRGTGTQVLRVRLK